VVSIVVVNSAVVVDVVVGVVFGVAVVGMASVVLKVIRSEQGCQSFLGMYMIPKQEKMY
jgi:hypothetical protein